MARVFPVAVFSLLLAQGAWGHLALPADDRAAFRKAVDEYQIFVVAHCAPDDVRAYVAARADRDRAFVRSLGKTELAADYRQAVADRSLRDRDILYECAFPPPPPPPPGAVPPPPPSAAEVEARQRESLAAHFAAGDRQFAIMTRLRDGMIGPRLRGVPSKDRSR